MWNLPYPIASIVAVQGEPTKRYYVMEFDYSAVTEDLTSIDYVLIGSAKLGTCGKVLYTNHKQILFLQPPTESGWLDFIKSQHEDGDNDNRKEPRQWTRVQIEDELRSIFERQELGDYDLRARFVEDLKFDSLEAIEFLLAVEHMFGIRFRSETNCFETVGALVENLEQKLT